MNEQYQPDNSDTATQAAPQASEQSLGERLLPYLFALMEACCADMLLLGLAAIHFLGTSAPILPLWAAFVLIAGTCWVVRSRQRMRSSSAEIQGTNIPGVVFFVVATAMFMALTVPWLLQEDTVHLIIASLLAAFLCYRGFRIAEREIDPAYVSKTLGIGLTAALVAIAFQALGPYVGDTPYPFGDLLVLTFGLVFLFLSLLARALSRLVFVREGRRTFARHDVNAQERFVIQAIAAFGLLFVAVALISVNLASPVFLTRMQQFVAAGYAWGTQALATVIATIMSPIIWLLNALHFKFAAPPASTRKLGKVHRPLQPGKPSHLHLAPPAHITAINAIEIALLIIFVFLITAVFVVLMLRAYNRGKREPGEQRESIWSWSLLWSGIAAFWRALLASFHIRRKAKSANASATTPVESLPPVPSVRDIRSIYHTLLKRAARLGYPRQRGETPFEYENRLQQHLPAASSQLAAITELYVAARYGSYVPGETEIGHIRDLWLQVERDWQR